MPLSQPLPDLASLDLLVSVGKLGSIRAAAEAHGVTQPAASMRMRSLEKVLGFSLLDRSRTGSTLTAEGRATAEWADVVLDDMRSLLAGASAIRARGRRHLRVAASMTVAEYLLPGWLRELATTHPDVSVALQMGNSSRVVELVLSGDADIGFIEGGRPPRRAVAKELRADELVVVVGRGHPWSRRRRPLGAVELGRTPLLMREPGSGTREVMVEELARHDIEPHALMELGSTTAIKNAAIAGTAPAVLSSLAVANEVRSGELVVVPHRELKFERTIRAIWLGRRAPTGAASKLVVLAAQPG